MASVTALSPSSDEWAKVSHLLQLALRSTEIKDLAVWSISNPHLNIQFERQTQDKLTLDSWVDVTTLNEERNPVREVCNRGFHFPDDGKVFSTGNIDLPVEGADTRQFLLCKIGVGKAYVVEAAEGDRKLPAAYDSLYLHKAVDADQDGKVTEEEYQVAATHAGRPADAYQHDYILTEAAQALPQYVVHFTYTPTTKAGVRVCDLCEAVVATVFCPTCNAYYCTDCDEETHSANRLMAKHKRIPVRDVENKFRSSITDVEARVSEALAVLGPSAGDATSKMLAGIAKSYEDALLASSSDDPMLEDRKRHIVESLAALDERVKAVQANSQAVEEAIYQKLQEALYQLQDETSRKVSTLLSEELELRRQLEHIQWAESFVPVLQNTLPPMSFISAWDRHAAYRSQMYAEGGQGGPRALDTVHADLQLSGHFAVISGGSGGDAIGAVDRTTTGGVSRLAPGPNPVASPVDSSRYFDHLGSTPAAAAAAAAYGQPAGTPAAPFAASTPFGADSGEAIQAMWASQLRARMGAGDATTPDGMPYTPEDSAKASLALAQINQAMIEAATKTYPPHLREQAEAARKEADAALQAAKTAHDMRFGGAAEGTSGEEKVEEAAPGDRAAPTASPASARQRLERRLAQFSMKNEATRRVKHQPALDGVDVGAMFVDSKIVMGETARTLYLCLPISFHDDGARTVFTPTKLLYTSASGAGATTPDFADAVAGLDAHNGAVVVLLKSGPHVFGGYAAEPLAFDDKFGGSPESFLFSITKDVKIPYHGRVRGPPQEGDAEAARAYRDQQLQMAGYDQFAQYQTEDGFAAAPPTPPHVKPWTRHNCVKSGPWGVQFGVGDLVVEGDFAECTSELENSYGVGLRPGSQEAKTFLAGKPVFSADVVEFWAVGFSMDPTPSYGGGY